MEKAKNQTAPLVLLLMLIDVVLNPAEIALLSRRDLSGTTCVIFDVLRATSSMVTALAHGAAAIYPACTIEEAFELKKQLPDALLGGERHGDPIAGFDLGNSPFEYREAVAGKTIISTTTNGTIALRACEHADEVLAGALLNLDALVLEIQKQRPAKLLIVCAGTFGDFALEDACAAGWLVAALKEGELTDAAQAALAVTRLFPEPLPALQSAKNGRALLAKGRGNEVDWCAQVSIYTVVGRMKSGVIRPLPQ
ncbi:MAG: comB [Chthoniobacteraceae bacterium]|nr:comB [Chthoniobacteraceae bacterium]